MICLSYAFLLTRLLNGTVIARLILEASTASLQRHAANFLATSITGDYV